MPMDVGVSFAWWVKKRRKAPDNPKCEETSILQVAHGEGIVDHLVGILLERQPLPPSELPDALTLINDRQPEVWPVEAIVDSVSADKCGILDVCIGGSPA